jgi:hypothetical protein
MNENVKAFIQGLKKLSPGDRLMAMHEYDGYKDALVVEAISQVQQNESKSA